MVKVLVACEKSQTICKEFRKLGFEAYSCDIQPCTGNNPEWHIQDNVLSHLNDGWDLMIAHPPCTYLSVSGLHWNKKDPTRKSKTAKALDFVRTLMNAPIQYICIENPISCISTHIRKPDQIIQPWLFGHNQSKATCLWLKNLPLLEFVDEADWDYYRCSVCGYTFPFDFGKYGCCDYPAKPLRDNQTPTGQNKLPPTKNRSELRSKTYQGIAKAMAQQWEHVLKNSTSDFPHKSEQFMYISKYFL